MSDKPTPWSYSMLGSFETCPRRHRLTKITREVVEPTTESLKHGRELHKAVELHVLGEQSMPPKYKNFIPLVDRVKRETGKQLVEYKFAVTDSFRPTDYWAKDAWCRGVIDFGVIKPTSAIVLDWKTGKPKPDEDQLRLFAAATFAHFSYVETVRTGFVWLAHNRLDTEVFRRDDVPQLWQSFLPRVQRLRAAEKSGDFPPRPSGLCKAYCPVPRSQCEFSGKV